MFWGGREGAEVDAAKDPVESIKRFREALNFCCEYVRDRKYGIRFALEAKPNEPRGDMYFPTTASYLAFIATLDHPDMVGVNPEVAHENMAGLNFLHVIAQAIEAGKLFHIDLNDQKFGRFDQDLRFGSESIKALFFVVKLLEDPATTARGTSTRTPIGPKDADGVWDFARGCMRTYLIFKEKARQFAADRKFRRCWRRFARAIQLTRRCWRYSPALAASRAHLRPRATCGPTAPLRASGSAGDGAVDGGALNQHGDTEGDGGTERADWSRRRLVLVARHRRASDVKSRTETRTVVAPPFFCRSCFCVAPHITGRQRRPPGPV